MYIPKFNNIDDTRTLIEHIRKHPFGSWSCLAEGEIVVNHIPFILHEGRGESGTLTGHVSRANPIWKTCSGEQESVVIFHGEDAYISPSWYPSKHQEGKAVPTWNYTVVQARGTPSFKESPKWILDHVNELTDQQEGRQALPWKVDDAPKEYIDRLINGIIGIEIPIRTMIGKWKIGQNRSHADQFGMVAGLSSRDDGKSQALGKLTKRFFQDE